jgi:hypothetical protein
MIDSGASVTPACSVANVGSVAETYYVRMRIGPFYEESTQVVAQPAGTNAYVTFATWTATQLGGPYAVVCSTALAGDVNPQNDAVTDSVFVGPATGLAAADRVPARFELAPAEPNPFTGLARISFGVPRTSSVRVNVYSPSGMLLRTINRSVLAPSRYSLTWDGRDNNGRTVPSGVYYLRMAAEDFVATRSLTRLK